MGFNILSKLKNRLELRRANALRAAGDRARDERRWAAAVEAYQEYLNLRPNDDGIWVQLGHAQKESGFLEEAERCYARALAIGPDVADTHLQMGHALKLQQRLPEAIAAYRRAHALDPASRYAADELAGLDAALEEHPQAATPKNPQSTAAPIAGAIDDGRVGALEKQVRLLDSQLRAVRVISGELLKARREIEALTARIVALEADNTALRRELDSRAASLEAKVERAVESAERAGQPFSRLADVLAKSRA